MATTAKYYEEKILNVKKNKGPKVLFEILKYFVAISLFLFTIFPIAWMILTSFKQRREVFGTFLPQTLDFSNYARVWRVMNFPQHFLNSVFVTGATVLIVVTVATLAGYAFARYKFPGRRSHFLHFPGINDGSTAGNFDSDVYFYKRH